MPTSIFDVLIDYVILGQSIISVMIGNYGFMSIWSDYVASYIATILILGGPGFYFFYYNDSICMLTDFKEVISAKTRYPSHVK